MPRLFRLLSPSVPFTLAVLAFTFSILSITSRDWASQPHYDPSLDMNKWSSPLYSTYRSPFQICTITKAQPDENTTTYTLNCNKFPAYGFDKTSCETVFATQDYNEARTGDQRLCQQIHRAGNLMITSTTFVTLGFTLTLLMTLLACLPTSKDTASAPPPVMEENQNTAGVEHHQRSDSHSSPKKRPSFTPYVNIVLITSFAIGAVSGVLAQFYGILGLIQSQAPNGAYAGARGNVIDPTQDNAAGPWVEGTALKAYLTCSWVFAAFAAGIAGAIWRLPRWEKGL